ncbi:hypothetical protein Tco_1507550 [Tanacetum coccineum]
MQCDLLDRLANDPWVPFQLCCQDGESSNNAQGYFSLRSRSLPIGRLVNGSPSDGLPCHKKFDLEPKVRCHEKGTFGVSPRNESMLQDRDSSMMLLLDHQESLRSLRTFSTEIIESRESSSNILPMGDGSCWKTFKPISSLNAEGKLKINSGVFLIPILHTSRSIDHKFKKIL